VFFFSRKEAKALVLLRRSLSSPDTAEADPRVWGPALEDLIGLVVFFFSRKEAKALVLLRRSLFFLPNAAEADPRVCGPTTQELLGLAVFFLSRKEAKALVLLRKSLPLPKLRRSRPRGFGGVPPRRYQFRSKKTLVLFL
jgi:hypothetical protein